jgi:hypothetical protein
MNACLAVLGWLSLATTASADFIGFNNGVGWTLNNGAGGLPSITGNALTITDNSGSTANSAYFNTLQPVGGAGYLGFTATFNYTVTENGGPAPADGFTFVIQNAGLNAVEGGGSDLGYAGMPNSASVQFNIWPYNGGGLGTNYYTGGNIGSSNSPGYLDVSPVNLSSGDTIAVTLKYDAAAQTLTETLLDTTTLDTFSTTFTGVDIAAAVGGNTAYVGFTGGDGLGTSTQVISDVAFQTPEPGSLTLLFTGLGIAAIAFRRVRRG